MSKFWDDKFLLVIFDDCDYAYMSDTMKLVQDTIESNTPFLHFKKGNRILKITLIDENMNEIVLWEKVKEEDLE